MAPTRAPASRRTWPCSSRSNWSASSDVTPPPGLPGGVRGTLAPASWPAHPFQRHAFPAPRSRVPDDDLSACHAHSLHRRLLPRRAGPVRGLPPHRRRDRALVADGRRRALADHGRGASGPRGHPHVNPGGIADAPGEVTRLRSVLRPLDDPAIGDGWNREEIGDLLHPAVELADAAVLVGLVARSEGTGVVLTLRTADLRHHGGQVSFPGGRVEPDDTDAVAAALRETREEIGVPPGRIQPVGLLDPLLTITGFRVLPVVAVIDPGYVARPDPREV